MKQLLKIRQKGKIEDQNTAPKIFDQFFALFGNAREITLKDVQRRLVFNFMDVKVETAGDCRVMPEGFLPTRGCVLRNL